MASSLSSLGRRVLVLLALLLLSPAPARARQDRGLDLPGTVWQETESGWSGTWVRRGQSNVFDATWTLGAQRVEAVLTIFRTGPDTIRIHRRDRTSASEFEYTGTFGPGGSVAGSYGMVGNPPTATWSARIEGWRR